MLGYVIRRAISLIPVLFFVALITFTLMHLAPGGPWDQERRLPPQVEANLNAKYHLGEPLTMQFVYYVGGLLRGDLGLSFTNPGYTVQAVISRGILVSMQLGLMAAAVAVLVGVPLGVLAALRKNSPLDYGSMFLAIIGYTTPSFVLGIFLIVIFAVQLRILPPGGWGKPAQMVMPVIALAAAPTAILARYTRASMLDVVGQDYVRTAQAKGLADQTVVVRHMLRNAMMPIVTILGPVMAALVTGSFVIERMFRIPGIGRLYIDAIFARDYPLIMGTTLLYAVAVALFNLLADLMYVVVDPRISYS
ncbi:MAG: ABC transporter permease [Chloroflexales bacterium]|nr:ABC transporter permease [Chloroflexales bacterium]